MLAFHNDKIVQDKYLGRIRAHAKADEFIRGTYWEEAEDGVFRGCAVGCTIHGSNHKDYETELGIPMWIAKLEDRIFEGVSAERAKTWPVEFLEAINLGSNLEQIKMPMLIFIVESARGTTTNERSLAAIDGVLTELRRDVLDLEKLHTARSAAAAAAAYAAYTAAADAANAAYAAAYAANAAYAAYAANAAYAAANAANAANAAYAAANAANAARNNAYEKFADKLLELIRNCK